ncbi:hypothetical protein KQX54_016534 [Cotesia glomerata]|uniref:Uncharacterized protein n=1 Tax=Cotesia glomerata TaxID=32391 RepID=A0AAV7I9Q2_COTGL|nr:hypothetical protein KQX54_016534 [Cotesia glomerata]
MLPPPRGVNSLDPFDCTPPRSPSIYTAQLYQEVKYPDGFVSNQAAIRGPVYSWDKKALLLPQVHTPSASPSPLLPTTTSMGPPPPPRLTGTGGPGIIYRLFLVAMVRAANCPSEKVVYNKKSAGKQRRERYEESPEFGREVPLGPSFPEGLSLSFFVVSCCLFPLTSSHGALPSFILFIVHTTGWHIPPLTLERGRRGSPIKPGNPSSNKAPSLDVYPNGSLLGPVSRLGPSSIIISSRVLGWGGCGPRGYGGWSWYGSSQQPKTGSTVLALGRCTVAVVWLATRVPHALCFAFISPFLYVFHVYARTPLVNNTPTYE